MDILFLLIPLSFVLIGGAIYLFFWAVKDGQFDDMDGAGHSILFDDDKKPSPDLNKKEETTEKAEPKAEEAERS